VNFASILIIAAAAALAAWGASALARRRQDAQLAVLRQEMQALAAGQSQAVAAQLGQLSQSFGQQIGQVTQQVQSGMASAGSLASEAQRAVSEQLQSATSMMGQLQRQLGEVQQSGRDLSVAAHTIEAVLGGAKSRGTLGEVALDRMLSDTLPPAAFEMQHRFSTGEIVDAVVRFRDKLLPIDSKFPLDDYRRLIEEGEEARRAFSQAVRAHADSIAKKYILPGEDTLEIARMFVPPEGVYYELLRSEDSKGVLLDEYCRRKGVIAVSPSTLYAYFSVILMGLQGMQIEENARRLHSSLAGLQKQLETFGGVYEKLGTHLRNAQQSYAEADRRLERARTELDLMAEGSLPAATGSTPQLEPAAKQNE